MGKAYEYGEEEAYCESKELRDIQICFQHKSRAKKWDFFSPRDYYLSKIAYNMRTEPILSRVRF